MGAGLAGRHVQRLARSTAVCRDDSHMSSSLAVPVGSEDHTLGRADAALTVVEYGDYECPYCAQAEPVIASLREEFGDDLRFVFRNLPLRQIHPRAEPAAEAAEAVALQGRFWEMHGLLYDNQSDLSDEALLRYAELAGADVSEVVAVLRSGQVAARIDAEVQGALQSGVQGTPTFFINGAPYEGSWDLDTFSQRLREELS
jgi:protein-disulfide isomerase